jgi:hypothetical protein
LGSEGTPTEPPGGAKRRFSIDSPNGSASEACNLEPPSVVLRLSTENEDSNDIKLVVDHIGTDHTEISITDADIIQEKENINIYYNSANMDEVEFCKWWLMAKNISKKAPKSLVLLEVGIDELHQKKDTMTPLDFRFKMHQHFKTISENRLSIISKIFWFHGLETEFPWLDRNLVQYLVANTGVLNTIFKSKGIYGNILLPEELF